MNHEGVRYQCAKGEGEGLRRRGSVYCYNIICGTH